jgi:branched-chain amino acid transport system substrate-binding protein
LKSKLFVLLLIGIMALAFVAGCGGGTDDGADGDVTTHTIVGLFPLTGGLSDYGQNSAEVAKLAASDINEWLEADGKDWRLRLEIDDSQTEGPVALRKMQSWFGEGVMFFAGPQGSGEATECLSFANANQILFVSPSSTSSALAIADDWFYRFCTDDTIQGPAIAGIALAAGVEHLIFGMRGDTWGDGLHAAALGAAGDIGLNVYPETLRYDPLKEDFTTDVALLDGYVSELVADGVALEDIGFCLIAFGEAETFLAQASEYEQLGQIRWFGSDGTANSAAIMANPVAGPFAVAIKFLNTMNKPSTLVEDSQLEYVTEHVKGVLGRNPDSYAYNTYDIVWALAKSIDEAGYDPVSVKEIFPRVTEEHTRKMGASGLIVLNEFGDRSFTDYELWLLNDDLKWESVGYYEFDTGKIVWEREVF